MKSRKAEFLEEKKLLLIQLRFKLPCPEADLEKNSFAADLLFLWDMFSRVSLLIASESKNSLIQDTHRIYKIVIQDPIL